MQMRTRFLTAEERSSVQFSCSVVSNSVKKGVTNMEKGKVR